MQKKLVLFLVLVMSLGFFTFGCGSNVKMEVQSTEEAAKMEGDPVENLAIKEKQWLEKLDAVREKIKLSYNDWEQGKVSREEFIKQLVSQGKKIRSLNKQYENHIEYNPIPPERLEEETYKNLKYGDKLRTEVNNFIFLVTEGIVDKETNKVNPATDDQIKSLFQKKIIERYDRYKTNLEPALTNVK